MIEIDVSSSCARVMGIITTSKKDGRMKALLSSVFAVFLTAHLTVQPIGCDVASSSSSSASGAALMVPAAPESLCSSCRGDNSTCRVVSGIFSRPQLNVGYNLVAHIPQGACNLTITEIRKSPNHLALQRRDGTFILNGDWRLSQSGDYSGAGTVFQYKRQDLKNPESVISSGPILEPIDLMVLYQQPNPVIKYEYLTTSPPDQLQQPLPPSPLLSPPPGDYHLSHHHRHSVSSGISAATSRPASYVRFPPPPGSSSLLLQQPQQHPAASTSSNAIAPFPAKLPSPGIVPEGHTTNGNAIYPEWNSGRRRDHHVSSTSSEKKFYWKVVAFTNCTEPCGGGVQRSIVRCVRAPAGNPVSDRRCAAEGLKPPSQTTRCNVKPCPAEWIIGDWSVCQGDCGEGFRTRPVHCQQKISPSLTMRVAEGACLTQRPESRITCQLRPCNHWGTSEWSQCSTQCGSGIRKRTAYCVGSSGQTLSDEDCDPSSKPAELTPCNMGPCEGVDWFVSDWSSECSQKCGSGIQTRHVVCSSLHPQQTQRNKAYYYSYGSFQNVSQYSKKRSSRLGSSELETNLIEDDDTNIDAVEMTDDEMEVEPVQCDDSKRPPNERECFSERSCGEPVWFTSDWSQCSVSCGNGLRTRQVLCVIFTRGKFKVASDSSLCLESTKPPEKQVCDSGGIKCPQRWFTTEWSECSALCGGGLQKRSVSCRSSNYTLPSSLCFDKDRPVERQSCNEQRCTLQAVSTTSQTYYVSNSNSNETGMIRDTSGVLPSPSSSLVSPSQSSSLAHDHRRISSSYRPRPSPTSVIPTEGQFQGEDDDRPANCTDEYRNCALVVQARLCRYKYYRSVCCSSCLDATT